MADLPRLLRQGLQERQQGPAQLLDRLQTAPGRRGWTGAGLVACSVRLRCTTSQAAIPLARLTSARLTSLYDLMDSAYDSQSIREFSAQLGHVAIIEPQKRGSQPSRTRVPGPARPLRRANHRRARLFAIEGSIRRPLPPRPRIREGHGTSDVRSRRAHRRSTSAQLCCAAGSCSAHPS